MDQERPKGAIGPGAMVATKLATTDQSMGI
jgi:hypothetical protein